MAAHFSVPLRLIPHATAHNREIHRLFYCQAMAAKHIYQKHINIIQ